MVEHSKNTQNNLTECQAFDQLLDTTNTPHYGIGQFLAKLLNPLTQNEFKLKDSFEAINKIHKILVKVFDQGYQYFLFDVASLVTNIPLGKTINVTLDRVYKDIIIDTKLKKSTLKKLIKGCCTKTVVSFNNIIYQQKCGASMGSSLGLVLSNIIMAELEKKIVKPMIESGKLKFYMRYQDNTLLLAKEDDVIYIFGEFNSFHKNLKFTMDRFDNNVHVLNIVIDKTDTDFHYMPTHTGQYSSFNNSLPWNFKTSCIKSLYHCAKKIYISKENFNCQIGKIKLFMLWNSYPSYTCNSIIERLRNNTNTTRNEETNNKKDNIWVRLPYLG